MYEGQRQKGEDSQTVKPVTREESAKPEDVCDSLGYLGCVPRAKVGGEVTAQVVMKELSPDGQRSMRQTNLNQQSQDFKVEGTMKSKTGSLRGTKLSA